MANHPQMPASMPIAQQRVVRGAAYLRMPGKVTSEVPRFSWPGLVDSLDVSPVWSIFSGGIYTEIVVDFVTPAVIEFDILINGTVLGTITTTATPAEQLFTGALPTVSYDKLQLELTNFGTGLAEDLSVTFRIPFA